MQKQFAGLLLFTAVLFGLIVRLSAPMNAGGPVNDGGLFLQMTRDLQVNDFALPQFTTYNEGDIPFAYPPLGFYLVGLIQSVTGMSLFALFTWLPALFSTLAIPAFYFLARELTGDSLKASAAALFYACVPKSFDWFVMGGGVTRAPAICFAFLTLAFVHRLFVTRDIRYVIHASILSSLLVLTHPEIAYHTALTVPIFALFFLRDRKSVAHAFVVAFFVFVLTSPWWLTVLQRHGVETFQTVLEAHPRNIGSQFLFRSQFNLAGELLLTVVGVFALVGLIGELHKRKFFLIVWVVFGGLVVSVAGFVLLAVNGFESVLKGLGDPSPFEDGFAIRSSRYTLLGLSAYLLMGGIIAASFYGYEYRLLQGEHEAMVWIAQNTEPTAEFIVVTGDASLIDPLSEWFPVLANRVDLATVQGHEWTPEQNLSVSAARYGQLQTCLNQSAGCLQGWDFDYVYIRKVKPLREGNIVPRPSILDASLRASQGYAIRFENEEAVIYEVVP